jgi:hypothetical protein
LVLLSCLADPLDTPDTIAEGVSTRASVAVGTLSGNFSVSADGAATYSIPIAVPKGRSGMEPSISINYSSQGGNGLLGVGWSLSAGNSQIARCGSSMRRDGAVRPVQFGAQDHFCLDGARLVQVGTITIPNVRGAVSSTEQCLTRSHGSWHADPAMQLGP